MYTKRCIVLMCLLVVSTGLAMKEGGGSGKSTIPEAAVVHERKGVRATMPYARPFLRGGTLASRYPSAKLRQKLEEATSKQGQNK